MSNLEEPLDPNATLEEMRSLVRRGCFQDLVPEDAHRLAELVEGLDRWLANGGFLPARWVTVPRLPANVEHDAHWWWIRPSELASRYGFDADRLRDDINPEDLNDRQFDFVMAALRFCDERTGEMMIPGE